MWARRARATGACYADAGGYSYICPAHGATTYSHTTPRRTDASSSDSHAYSANGHVSTGSGDTARRRNHGSHDRGEADR